MTSQDKDCIQNAIRHIQTAVDVDPWAVKIAVEVMEAQLFAEGTTSDLISRQAAIDAANRSYEVCDTGSLKDYRDVMVLSLEVLPPARDEAIESLVKAIEELSERIGRKWIPVAEQLPEDNGVYLVTTISGHVQMQVFNYNGNSEEYWKRCNRAWMPFPEPYIGGLKDG